MPNSAESDGATPAMMHDTLLRFSLPSVQRKKVTAAFDGGRITSDGGVLLLGAFERSLGIAARLASLITDRRNPLLVTHSVTDILRARMLAIACGYEDADDLDHLRSDPGFKLACGHLPDSGADLCSQPTVSRWENAPDLRAVIRMSYAMVDIYCASYRCPPRAVTLDLDDTVDIVHGHHRDVPPGGDAAAHRHDAIRPGDCRPSAAAGAPHPQPLARHAADHTRRRALWAPRGDGMVW